MTDENGKKDSSHTASGQPKTHRQWLTFREFVRHQEVNGEQENRCTFPQAEGTTPSSEEMSPQQPLSPSLPVPLAELMDLLFAGTMLFIFITMLLLFAY